MKTIIQSAVFVVLTMCLLIPGLDAASVTSASKAQFKGQKVLSLPDGKVLMAPDEIVFPSGIVVRTNGTYTVQGGKQRQLQEGETLGEDGMLTRPDGSISLVIDHVTSSRGIVVVFKDGAPSDLRAPLKLGDGAVVTPDGKITLPGSSPRRLLDGELFPLTGGKQPARDSVTLQGGKVFVQKDGARLTIEPARSITMNEGTKILGDGTVIKPNGDRIKLSEGQVVILEGVVIKPR